MTDDVFLTGGRMPGHDGSLDVLLADGRIRAIVPTGIVAAPNSSRVIELEGRYLIPGLWDNHVHFTQWSLLGRRFDFGAAHSPEAVAVRVAEVVHPGDPATERAELVGARLPGAGFAGRFARPVIGYGVRDALWAGELTRGQLDAAAGAQPVVLFSNDLHSCWLNTAALRQYGLAEHPSGHLVEDDCFRIARELDDVSDDEADELAALAGRRAAALGVVGVVDFEMRDNYADWSRRIAAGQQNLRVAFGIYSQHLALAAERGLRTGDVIPKTGGLLSVGPFKVITDGSLGTRTAYCFEPYAGFAGAGAAAGAGFGVDGSPGHSHGMLTVAPDALLALLRRATAQGLRPAVHAIGDHANRLALDAFEALAAGDASAVTAAAAAAAAAAGVAAGAPGPGVLATPDLTRGWGAAVPASIAGGAVLPWGRIEHAQLLADTDFERFAALGVAASVQPEHAMDDRDIADRYWAGRTDRAFAFERLRASGAALLLGSDAPVAPLDPWISLSAAVSRARDGRPAWHAEQRLSALAALAAATNGVGTIGVGLPADLAIVELDPLTADPGRLRTMPVAATFLAGRPTHLGAWAAS
ncbi:amidohydrolase [Subtercola sp. RTI3]|uniref:amidohydrolase n=1 Tax=Subtercola sp. RTI3 TaxID=3048639 RepID=UPI002B2386A9|nr:amidohydrolase family protein [Subtercola sp. RTI3]MEA9986602.1 amidohydrolase family protein [Subtercola sp. RTI3]